MGEHASILLVDDDVLFRRAVGRMISQMGYSLRAVGDGVAALELCCSWNPTLVIADLAMPGMSGVALVRAIRSRMGAVNAPPVILTSAWPEGVKLAHSPGVRTFLQKPFDRDALRRAVEQAIGGPDWDGPPPDAVA